MSELDTFFTTMVGFLNREHSAAAVEDKLGVCPSGRARLEVYQHLVAGDIAGILQHVHKSVRHAMDRIRPGLWDESVKAYWASRPADHWEPARFGEHFSEFLAADESLPPYMQELADFHWTRYLASIAKQPDDDAVMDRTVFVRQYTHTVPQYALAEDPNADLPTPQPTIALIYQSLQSLHARVFYPSLPSLIALAERTDTSPELRAQFADLGADALAQGEAKLIEHGVLRPR